MNFFENSPSPTQWHNFDVSNLNVDQAYLNLTSTVHNAVRVYWLSSDCEECPFSYVTSLERGKKRVMTVSTKYESIWRFYGENLIQADGDYIPVDDENFICQINGDFGEFGVYQVVVQDSKCEYRVRKEPVNIYSPLLFVFFALLFICIGIKLVEKRQRRKQNANEEEPIISSNTKSSSRIRSIDTFRGFALTLMMFVNDDGGGYWFFQHTTWGGCYPADLLFPWFLWIMGLCIPLSQRTLSSHGPFTLIKNILRRSALLYMFGLTFNSALSGPVDLPKLRLVGVLQRIAVCYAVVSLISVFVWRSQDRLFSPFNYSVKLLRQWLIYLGLLCIHTFITFFLSVPGCPRGYFGPGGIHKNGIYSNCTGGAAGYMDMLLLGGDHIGNLYYVHTTYRTKVPFDPENILGTLTSIFQTFLGTQAGMILCMRTSTPMKKIRYLCTFGCVTLSLGLLLHYLDIMPINKKLWTLSFTLMTSGLAFLLFAFFYYTVDYLHLWDGAPFFYPGTNSVSVFLGHRISYKVFPWHWKVSPMNTHFLLLIENIWGVILWIAITRILFKKRLLLNV